MTPERAKELLPIITAFANGDAVETRYRHQADRWHNVPFNFVKEFRRGN